MNKTVCKVCGKEYEVCALCPDVESFTPWRRICDSIKHFQLFVLASNFNAGVIPLSEAFDEFKRIGVSEQEVDTFVEPTKSILKKILKFKSNKDGLNKSTYKTQQKEK